MLVHHRLDNGTLPARDKDYAFAAYFSLIEDAFKAVLPVEISTFTIRPRALLIDINPEWRQEFMDALSGGNPTNQGLPFGEDKPLHTWHNLRFRSQTEIRIAEALERVDRSPLLFLPNCMARLGDQKGSRKSGIPSP
jgi:hypothetical protein